MCKVMVMSGINDVNREKSVAFIKEMAKEMSPGNKDGCGYAAIDDAGKLFGERWLENSQAFTDINDVLQFGDAIEGTGEYNNFGDLNLNKVAAITLHTRMATSAKGIANTHPFVYENEDTSLIHNGVIDNDKDFTLQVSTCDSEAILQAYLLNGVNHNPAMIGAMAEMLYGYYAAALFTRDASGNRILDIFKGNHASLVVTYLYELGTYVFSTSEMDISIVCRRLGISMGKAYTIKEGNLLRVDPFTSKIISREKFKVQSRHKSAYHYTGTSHYKNDYGNSGTSYQPPTTRSTCGIGTITEDEPTNIIDASNAGAKEHTKLKINEELLGMMSLVPNIIELPYSAVRELGMVSGWWARQ